MSEPDPLADVDLVPGGDPDLADAPTSVRRADAWLRSTQTARWIATGVGLFGLFAPLVGAALVHDLGIAADPIPGIVLVGGMSLWGAYTWVVARKWGIKTNWASTMITRYKEIRALGLPEAAATTETPLDRMILRIHALAGERTAVRDAATAAGRRARRIEAELGHLAKAATGDPQADGALDSARDRLRIELEHTRATVAETYAALAELASRDEPEAELEDTVKRLSAELEVDRAAVARRNRIAAATRQ